MLFEYVELPSELKKFSGRLVVLLSESDSGAFLKELRNHNEAYHGAVFPALIFNNKLMWNGALVAQLGSDAEAAIIPNIQELDLKVLNRFSVKPTLYCFVDAFSSALEDFLSELYTYLGEDARMIGGGAGKMTLQQEPVIFDEKGIHQNAAILVGIEETIGIGVGHGWKKIEGPFLVTGADGRSLLSLDYESAKDFYAELVIHQSGEDPREGDFFQLAKSYPLGVIAEDEELVVRDPIALSGHAISLVGDIHEHAMVHLLYGDNELLIEAARNVSQMALSQLEGRKPERVFICDCISRSIFLDGDFQKELDAINNEVLSGIPTAGALTLGEIASNDDRMIRFHNKTCVVAIR